MTQQGQLDGSAVRPYPSQYISTWSHEGREFTIRPIRPDDEALMVDFHRQLSESSVYMRFFLPMKLDARIAHERLLTRCCVDYDQEIALVVEYSDDDGRRRMAGVARMVRERSDNSAEVAFLIADRFQGMGLGTYLLDQLIRVARSEGIVRLEAATLSENYIMKDIFVRAGFRFGEPQSGVIEASLIL